MGYGCNNNTYIEFIELCNIRTINSEVIIFKELSLRRA